MTIILLVISYEFIDFEALIKVIERLKAPVSSLSFVNSIHVFACAPYSVKHNTLNFEVSLERKL